MLAMKKMQTENVHGDIRHLEINPFWIYRIARVHGDIRHLEMSIFCQPYRQLVHGDIRHLEIKPP